MLYPRGYLGTTIARCRITCHRWLLPLVGEPPPAAEQHEEGGRRDRQQHRLVRRLADTVPGHALGAGAGSVDRVRRLLVPAPRRSRVRRVLGGLAVAALLGFPVATTVTAAGLAVHAATCDRPAAADC
ncbi:hypothetical protein O7600_06280 [Micromonospora sp. WMMA1998]|uniref:hypothetical protein n=1 Tax=Micromonospora sp. WMMA1998 TaxID=3015167 RepID=UPI00248AF019|nr:hypothetical protein [Micromonospora sp. WMMA1998]WBC16445.1 hypothetical protein O7600_06280 [Micromonospora sp. WMMA1998]